MDYHELYRQAQVERSKALEECSTARDAAVKAQAKFENLEAMVKALVALVNIEGVSKKPT